MKKFALPIIFCMVFLSSNSFVQATNYPVVIWGESIKPGAKFEWKLTKYQWYEIYQDLFGPTFEMGDVIAIEINENLSDYAVLDGYNFSFNSSEIFTYYLNDEELSRSDFEMFQDRINPGYPWFLPLYYVTKERSYDYIDLLYNDLLEEEGVRVENFTVDGGWTYNNSYSVDVELNDKYFEVCLDFTFFREWQGTGYVLNWTTSVHRELQYDVKEGYLKRITNTEIHEQTDYVHENATYTFKNVKYVAELKIMGQGFLNLPFDWDASLISILTVVLFLQIKKKKSTTRNKKERRD
ncbi:MAG: hypothetical protein ACTSQE_01360 [Candidatus Heimdallarchaeaceae archaeon]